jgi:superfamily II DNA/RNA helicase
VNVPGTRGGRGRPEPDHAAPRGGRARDHDYPATQRNKGVDELVYGRDRARPAPAAMQHFRNDHRMMEEVKHSKDELHIPSHSPVLQALNSMGITQPTLIQQRAIPKINKLIFERHRFPACPLGIDVRRDTVVLHSQTGSGKTFAFLVPILEQIMRHSRAHACSLHTVILVPTETLAAQMKINVDSVIDNLQVPQFAKKPRVCLTYMGEPAIAARERITQEAPDILITTAANFLTVFSKFQRDEIPFIRTMESDITEFLDLGPLFQELKCIVIDEADLFVIAPGRRDGRVNGRLDEIRKMNSNSISVMNTLLQCGDPVLVFSSASINKRFKSFFSHRGWSITNRIIDDQVEQLPLLSGNGVRQIASKDEESSDDEDKVDNIAKNMSCPETIEHKFVYVERREDYPKMIAQAYLTLRLKDESAQVLVIVPNHFHEIAEDTVDALKERGVLTYWIDKAIEENPTSTDEVMKQLLKDYKSKNVEVMVSSAEVIRGMDFPDLKYVFLAPYPRNAQGYLHAAGRTGRQKKSGVAVSFFEPKSFEKYEVVVSSLGVVAKEMEVIHPKQSRKRRN